MDAVEMLKNEHRGAKSLMEQIIKSEGPQRKSLFEKLKKELEGHDKIEEEIFYPAVLSNPKSSGFPAVDKQAHQAVEAALLHLENLSIGDKDWLGAFKTMQTQLLDHIAMEETSLFVTIKTILSGPELASLGEKMESAKPGAAKVA
ncbi:MAG TPA: hemerythrin domain-containing protein [bacterium]|jgi:hemerythrin superfamily protein|nr:hemerythrin domain-containing protein [bacterium]